MVDLGRKFKFPARILITSLRPDIIILSEATKELALIELTVPWEEWLKEAFEWKNAGGRG